MGENLLGTVYLGWFWRPSEVQSVSFSHSPFSVWAIFNLWVDFGGPQKCRMCHFHIAHFQYEQFSTSTSDIVKTTNRVTKPSGTKEPSTVFSTVNWQPLCQSYVIKLGRGCFRNIKFVRSKLAIIQDEKKIALNYTRLHKVK